MSEIKNWPQFNGADPYSVITVIHSTDWKFVPLKNPCQIHQSGFDCYSHLCTCEEYRYEKRPKEEIEKIMALQKDLADEAILRRADKIRATYDKVLAEPSPYFTIIGNTPTTGGKMPGKDSA